MTYTTHSRETWRDMIVKADSDRLKLSLKNSREDDEARAVKAMMRTELRKRERAAREAPRRDVAAYVAAILALQERER